jgi:hypothetical protein
MYGYANVPKYFGCFFLSSAGEMDVVGISAVVGAAALKTPESCHLFWYFFSIAMRVSRFSVFSYSVMRHIQSFPLFFGTYIFELQGVFRTTFWVQDIGNGIGCCHIED